MSDKFNLNFISQSDFENHVHDTIRTYVKTLSPMNLERFNLNVVDPIKFTFDSALLGKNIDEIINLEINRQRDRSNANAMGYFNQNMFKYLKSCEVPEKGFDIIVNEKTGGKIYVEMKNKYNTMNSSSSQKTYISMQNKVMKEPTNQCWLVEVIAQRSQNIAWGVSVNGEHLVDERIRRVSIDRLYEKVTGVPDAFMQICRQLPETIRSLMEREKIAPVGADSVICELRSKDQNPLRALYKEAFGTYIGFDKF